LQKQLKLKRTPLGLKLITQWFKKLRRRWQNFSHFEYYKIQSVSVSQTAGPILVKFGRKAQLNPVGKIALVLDL